MPAPRLCTFTLGDALLGLEVPRVQEVLRPRETTRIPLARANIRGLINLRGQIVMAIDLRRCLGMPEAPAGLPAMDLVLRTDDGPVSFLVDAVHDVVDVDESTFEAPPANLFGAIRDMIRGTYAHQGRLLLLLNADAVLGLIETPTGPGPA